MVRLGIMIEGQEGLTWERWNRIVDAGDRLGFDSVWRSDHLFSVMGQHQRETLALWPSLTVVPLRSERLEFGQMVSPTTFRHPVHLAFEAVALDRLSNGRFWLGVGAGWNVAEHNAFGFPLLDLKDRMDRFEEALKVITLLWSGEIVSFRGKHFQLDNARASLTPLKNNKVPIVIGGSGEKRTLRLVAEYADEWNITTTTSEGFAAKNEVLKRHCDAVGRDPSTIRRSQMTGHIIGRDREELRRRAANIQQVAVGLQGMSPDEAIEKRREAGWVVGTPEEIVEDLRQRGEMGLDRIMLQTFDMDDIEALELFASEVMPHV
jgi:F420-dependent oxidoreductase-like protein